jgi:hypothetical protein
VSPSSGDCDNIVTSLLDRVKPDGNKLRVAFNTGNGFAAERDWQGAFTAGVGKSGNTSLGAGVYFTIGIGPLCLAACYVIINPGVDFSRNLTRLETDVRDVDGDGYADQLASESDASLSVARNLTGRTNLLKTVHRPLGAVMDLDYERVGNTYELPLRAAQPGQVHGSRRARCHHRRWPRQEGQGPGRALPEGGRQDGRGYAPDRWQRQGPCRAYRESEEKLRKLRRAAARSAAWWSSAMGVTMISWAARSSKITATRCSFCARYSKPGYMIGEMG